MTFETGGPDPISGLSPWAVPTGDGPMPARLALPAAGNGPGLVLFQEIFGVSPYIQQRAIDLAALGYVVVVPELYWRLPDATIDPDGDELAQALALMQQLDWATTVSDGVAAFDATAGRPDVAGGTGLVGFCFGGGLAFNVAAETDPAVLVSYYGSALPGLLDLAPQVTAPSLHHFGTDDSYLDREAVARITAALSRPGTEIESYAGAGHAFDNPNPPFHHPEAAAAAWQVTVDFLARELPVGG